MRFIPSTEGPQVRERHGVRFNPQARPGAAPPPASQLPAPHDVRDDDILPSTRSLPWHFELADTIADGLAERGTTITSGDRLYIADQIESAVATLTAQAR